MKQPRIRKNASAMKPAWGCPPLDAAVLPRSVANAAAHFQTAHALADAAQLWRTLRAMDSEAVLQGARWLADQLRDAGLDNVQVIEFPADGRTSIGGWLMPIAWTVRDAVLRAAPAGRGGEVFADHAINPQSIAMYSPPTPGGGWVEGRVVAAPDVASVRRRLRGAFLLLAHLVLQAGQLDVEMHIPALLGEIVLPWDGAHALKQLLEAEGGELPQHQHYPCAAAQVDVQPRTVRHGAPAQDAPVLRADIL